MYKKLLRIVAIHNVWFELVFKTGLWACFYWAKNGKIESLGKGSKGQFKEVFNKTLNPQKPRF